MSSMAMPPPDTVAQQSYNGASQHASIGPLIGVLVVIIMLGIIAVMIGRLCSGRRIMGHGEYDIERWAENKCSTCIDGTINLPHSLPRTTESNTSLPATPIRTPQEQQSSQNSPPT